LLQLIYFVSLISGIFLGLSFNINIFCLFLFLFLSIFTKRKTFIFSIFFFILVFISASRVNENGLENLSIENKKLKSLKCYVLSTNNISPFSSSFIVQNNGEKFLLKLKTSANLEKGEVIEIKNVKIKNIPEKKNPWDFDSKKYYNRRGIFYILEGENFTKIGYKNNFYKIISLIREKGEKKVSNYLPYSPEEKELIKTIVIGKNEIPYFLQTLGIRSGCYHILVISGLHFSFIFFFLRVIFIPVARLNNTHPKIFPVFALIFLWTYAIITGLNIPVVRATLMFTFFLLGEIFEKDIEGPNSIFFAAFLILLLRPISLFDLSFLLSFITTFTIIHTVRKFNYIKNPLLSFLIITTFAQISSLPLILYNFGNTYFIGFLSNIFLIPLSTILIVTSLFSFIFSFGFQISSFFANIFIKLMHIFAIFSPEITYIFPISSVIACYSLLTAILLKKAKKIKLFFLSLSFVFLTISIFKINFPNKDKKIYFFSANKPCILVKDGENGILFSPDDFKNRNFLVSLSKFLREQKIKEVTLIFTENSLNPLGTFNQIKKYVKNVIKWEEKQDKLYGYKIEKKGNNFIIKKGQLSIFLAIYVDEEIQEKQKVFYLCNYKKRKGIVNSIEEIKPVIGILPAKRKKYQILNGTFENYFLEEGSTIIEWKNETLKIVQL